MTATCVIAEPVDEDLALSAYSVAGLQRREELTRLSLLGTAAPSLLPAAT